MATISSICNISSMYISYVIIFHNIVHKIEYKWVFWMRKYLSDFLSHLCRYFLYVMFLSYEHSLFSRKKSWVNGIQINRKNVFHFLPLLFPLSAAFLFSLIGITFVLNCIQFKVVSVILSATFRRDFPCFERLPSTFWPKKKQGNLFIFPFKVNYSSSKSSIGQHWSAALLSKYADEIRVAYSYCNDGASRTDWQIEVNHFTTCVACMWNRESFLYTGQDKDTALKLLQRSCPFFFELHCT